MYYPSDCFILYLPVLSWLSCLNNKRQEPPRPKFGILPCHLTMSKLIITNNAMITLYVKENNPITPYFYNNLIANLQFHRLTCTCGHSGCLSVHGYYTRSLKAPGGKLPFRICRVICSCCHHTHGTSSFCHGSLFPDIPDRTCRNHFLPWSRKKLGRYLWIKILPLTKATAAISFVDFYITGNNSFYQSGSCFTFVLSCF